MKKDISDKLIYDDLVLGEKRKNMFLEGKSYNEINENSAFYLNTKPVIYGLNATDLAIAAVLGGVPLLLPGRPGCGKSQLASDFARYYFGGTQNQGLAVEIDGAKKELDIYEEIFSYLNKDSLSRELSDKVSRCFFDLEEFNRQPYQTQNQFLNLQTGKIVSPRGESLHLGKDGYSMVVATANLGNGEYKGTFEEDGALRNRFGVVLDFNYSNFKPTEKDLEYLDLISESNSNVKDAPIRNISEKIIQANKQIRESTLNKSLEERAFMNFLRFGLKNCRGDGSSVKAGEKGISWPLVCQDCSKNKDSKYLCSLIREIDGRTIQVLPRYAASLEYLIKLKNPNMKIDVTDLLFKTFELTGAYQDFLNQNVLNVKYAGQNPIMMGEVVETLKEEYLRNKSRILETLNAAKSGLDHRDLFYLTRGNKKEIRTGFSNFSNDQIQKFNAEENKKISNSEFKFNNSEIIGYSWVLETGDLLKEIKEKRKENIDNEGEKIK